MLLLGPGRRCAGVEQAGVCLGACCAEWWRGEGGRVGGTGSRWLGAVDEVGGGGVLAREMLVGVDREAVQRSRGWGATWLARRSGST